MATISITGDLGGVLASLDGAGQVALNCLQLALNTCEDAPIDVLAASVATMCAAVSYSYNESTIVASIYVDGVRWQITIDRNEHRQHADIVIG